jgi:hypothetical protein
MWFELMVDVAHPVEPFNVVPNKQEIERIDNEVRRFSYYLS